MQTSVLACEGNLAGRSKETSGEERFKQKYLFHLVASTKSEMNSTN